MASLTFTVSTSRSNRKQQGGNRRPQKKTFCKVCFDAGKTEQEYTCHFLKDRPGPNGKVVCPTLLATECRYCRKRGHFKSHCPVLDERKRDKGHATKARSVNRRQKFEAGSWMTSTVSKQFEEAFAACKMQSKTSVPVQKFTSESAFSALYESDEEEQEVEVSYTRGPSVAVAQAPQGAWNTKFSIQTAMKPAMKPATKPAMKPARVEVKKCTNLPRKDAIIAELADLNAELQEETQKSSGAWADAGDIDDLETKIADLEEELESLDTIFLC
jgi:hypothetical protein